MFSFTKSECIALEMLIQQYQTASARRKIDLRKQMKLLGYTYPKHRYNKPLSPDEFRKCVKIKERVIPFREQSVQTISMSSIITEYIEEYSKDSSFDDIHIDYSEDLLLQLTKLGFKGFCNIEHGIKQGVTISNDRGFYIIMLLSTKKTDKLILSGSYIEKQSHWVDNARILYIGTSSDLEVDATISDCVKSLADLESMYSRTENDNILHSLIAKNELLVCWKSVSQDNLAIFKAQLIDDFRNYYGKVPFLNSHILRTNQ